MRTKTGFRSRAIHSKKPPLAWCVFACLLSTAWEIHPAPCHYSPTIHPINMFGIDVKELRPAIVWLSKMGKHQADIATLFEIPHQTVSRDIRRYEETGTFGDRPRSGRPRTATDAAHEEAMETLLAESPQTSANSSRKLAKKIGTSNQSAWRMMKRSGYFPWKMQKHQFLSESARQKRRERCPKLLERFANNAHRNVLFTDEKLFVVQQAHNHQNDRIWARGPPSRSKLAVQRAVKPKSIMVWAGVGYNFKTPLIFVEPGSLSSPELNSALA